MKAASTWKWRGKNSLVNEGMSSSLRAVWLADLARGNLEAQLENCAVRTDTDIPELKAKVRKFDELLYANSVSLNAVEPERPPASTRWSHSA